MNMLTEIILNDKVTNENIRVQVIRSGRKSLGLEVRPDGTVLARIPARLSDRELKAFIEKQQDWILKKVDQVKYYCAVMQVTVGRITIRNQKTRWGSCSSAGNVNFNYQLYYLSDELLDYVVVHELAHRRHMNHSKEFWSEVARYCPDYRARRKQLKEYQLAN